VNQADDDCNPDLVLWYDKPASRWLEALPLGNGRLGAMVFGGTGRERLQLNEDSLWDGHAQDPANPDALAYLPEVRRLLFAGQNREAEEMAAKHLLGRPASIKSYQTLGDLFLDFDHAENDVTGYRRELDLDAAIVRTAYQAGETTFTREVFASYPDQMIVARVAADKPGALSVRVSLSRGEVIVSQGQKAGEIEEANQTITVTAEATRAGGVVGLVGQVEDRPDGKSENRGVRFAAVAAVDVTGGTVRTNGNTLVIENADALVVRLAAATSNRAADVEAACQNCLAAAQGKSYDELRAAHVADHQSLFRRVHLDLDGGGENASLPTDARLQAVTDGANDPGLAALYFQYGRYLLIASSRPGSLPANLQGVWSEHVNAPWDADYHTNINIQMNYWPAEAANLAECHAPLFDWMKILVAPGTRTAKVHYGANGGWVVHHVSNPYGHTTPSDGLFGVWPMGAAWLCRHLWEHYRFSGNQNFLAETAYPLLKGAARFLLGFLVEEPQTGRLVTCPSHSPENRFVAPDGSHAWFTYGATMDMEITHDLFTRTVQAAEILGADKNFAAELTGALARLLPLQISAKDGRLQEWPQPYDEPEPGHRHVSHLFALHPGDQITPRGTPELCAAARRSLEYRLSHGGGHTGWSRAWMVNFFARFEDGETAHHHLTRLLADSTTPNLFDTHPYSRGPVFQIDGNLGGCAGIAEMLVQSHVPNEISLLPALPASAWPSGEARGLRARGGWTIESLRWTNGRLDEAILRAPAVVSPNAPVTLRVPPGTAPAVVTFDGEEVVFEENVARFTPRGRVECQVRAAQE